MDQQRLQNIIEAILLATQRPLTVSALRAVFDKTAAAPEPSAIRAALAALTEVYAERGMEVKEVAGGFRIQIKREYAEWVNRVSDERPPRYSRALLETLAIIAYRQPVTRAEIEDIRGVSVGTTIIRTLEERDWIRVVGRRDVPGRPELLATSKAFLDYFNLKKLSELPALAAIKDFDEVNPDLFAAAEEAAASGDGAS